MIHWNPLTGTPTFALTLVLAVCSPGAAGVTTRYVDDDAVPGGDGLSWSTAYDTLEDALDELTTAALPITEIRVAQGVYRPDGSTGDRTLSYIVDGPGGVAICGGYAGVGAPNPDHRNIDAFVTRLTGDLLGNDTDDLSTRLDNSYQIMRCITESTISGVNFEHAYSLDDEEARVIGGAIRGEHPSLRVVDCSFLENSALRGGAIAFYNIYFNVTIANCRFDGNFASQYAGAVLFFGLNDENVIPFARIGNCVFTRNRAMETGGAILAFRARHGAMGCVFSGNEASVSGGAVYNNDFEYSPTYHNCAFVGNASAWGFGGAFAGVSIAEMNNCILVGNTDASGDNISSQLHCQSISSARNNCVPGWDGRQFTVGTNIQNLNTDPRFVNAAGVDGVYGTEDDDLRLLGNSPCIDAGTDRQLNDRADIDDDGIFNEALPIDLFRRPRFIEDQLSPNVGSSSFWNIGPIDIGPIEYQEDCNANSLIDTAEILANPALDSDGSGLLDMCEPSLDCNENGLSDSLEIFNGTEFDCNENGVPDSCDIASGLSLDIDNDDIPDECQSIVIYVDDDAPDGGDGRTWATALQSLHEGLKMARNQRAPSELWIAGGSYKPSGPDGDRAVAFRVPEGLSVKGSFAASGSKPDHQDVCVHPTILEGDLNDDDSLGFRDDNANQLLIGEGLVTPVVIDSIVIRNGVIPEYPEGASMGEPIRRQEGAGLWVPRAPLILSFCTFEDNHSQYGGALSNGKRVSGLLQPRVPLVIDNCKFIGNSSSLDGGALKFDRADIIILSSTFILNDGRRGGGIYMNQSTLRAERCRFTSNVSEAFGAAIYSLESPATLSVTLSGCEVLANHVLDNIGTNNGAAVYSAANGLNRLTLHNCTASGNTPKSYFAGQLARHNTIVWGNESGNDSVDPRFIDPLGPDGLFATGDEDLRLQADSPAIDAGDGANADPLVALDLDGEPRFVNDCAISDTGVLGPFPAVVDLGAYEFQADSLTGDINTDGLVNIDDLNAILSVFGTSVGIGDPRDIANNDGLIDIDDLNVILANFGATCP